MSNKTGNSNTANGFHALRSNTSGDDNTACGTAALLRNKTGTKNTANGYTTLYSNTTGNKNTANGYHALYQNTTGDQNTASGSFALSSNITGRENTALGFAAGLRSKGTGNVYLGYYAGAKEVASNRLYIANNERTPLIFGKFSQWPKNNKLGIGTKNVPVGDTIMVWNGAHLTVGGVWANASSRDLKDHIRSLSPDDANTALAALEPVRYVYRNSPDEEYMGFIAEDVPALVATNDRRSLVAMDIVAVLTTVAKEQKVRLTEKGIEIAALRAENEQLAARQDELSRRVDRLMQTMAMETPVLVVH